MTLDVPAVPSPAARDVWSTISRPPLFLTTKPEYDFRAGVPDAGLFPFEIWQDHLARQFRDLPRERLTYEDPRGHAGLRTQIARRLELARGVQVRPDAVLVTGGSQQALDIAAKVLLRPGDRVAVENPGYPPPRQVFTALGARPVGVPVDEEGIVVEAIPPGCRLVYVTPAHQFPLGMPMSARRRAELIAWAGRHDAVIVEDDYDSDFRFTDDPLEPLYVLDPGRVIHLGSFSKVLLPALRLGFLLAPPALRIAMEKAKYFTDLFSPSVEQAALARFMADGELTVHVRKAQAEYRARRKALIWLVRRDFADVLTLLPASAGLHVTATAPAGMWPLVRAARRAGVWLYSLGDFTEPRDSLHGLLLGYGAVPSDRVQTGLGRLRELM
ncbi:PLP-dependent aminotransferase family protein [Actinomadura sp. DC4]|uniref:MocR-like pyridoxine biosynthesis transcription factor PdxR n=1 Tax=Actinomadura sp. DC4 TaxID=3055069 RepID=UPI0025AF8E0C|nr:PLP-dependent aminotransferase family protein [Actinomadura sp. DC4]MDN3356404.1 PLP-dependent aminotransferase family protein [Actinomadura sp. DC4]